MSDDLLTRENFGYAIRVQNALNMRRASTARGFCQSYDIETKKAADRGSENGLAEMFAGFGDAA
jgi:hypothetical protein